MLVLIQSVLASRNIGALVSIAAVMLLGHPGGGDLKTLRSFIFTDAGQPDRSGRQDHHPRSAGAPAPGLLR